MQYLDDLEDLLYVFALKWESIRCMFSFALFIAASVTFQALAIFLALTNPPLAFAVAALLLVGLLYRAVVTCNPGSTVPA